MINTGEEPFKEKATKADINTMSDQEILALWPDATITYIGKEPIRKIPDPSITEKTGEYEKPNNINLKLDTMTPEQVKEQFPETFNIIFKAGMKAGIKNQSGVLPAPGTNPEFDALNAKIDEAMSQPESKTVHSFESEGFDA